MARNPIELDNDTPLIPASTNLPEITIKACVLAILLAVLLGAANAYLALKVGVTIAASIPAAVISMAIFRLFKNSNVLENNLVQTAASAGEGVAGAVTFILPAMIITKFWTSFNFWQTMLICMIGGALGVLFSVPLRRVLLNLSLPFPEGTAIGNILRASAEGGARVKSLIHGAVAGAFVVFCQTGLQIIGSTYSLWFRAKNFLYGTTLGVDAALFGAGYIIGIRPNIAMLLGVILVWVIGLPFLSIYYGIPVNASSPYDAVMTLWSEHIRYIGVGTMLIAGIWTLLSLLKPVVTALFLTKKSMEIVGGESTGKILRTEYDMPMKYVLSGVAVLSVCAYVLLYHVMAHSGLNFSTPKLIFVSFVAVAGLLVFGFFSAVIIGYIVGLIGSTNSPVSGILIINILIMSLVLTPLIHYGVDFTSAAHRQAAIAIILFAVTMIGVAATITSENIQDLKAGRMVGATPWKQQTMMLIGVMVAAVAIAPVLELLFQAYGMGGVFPRPGMNPQQMLPAPQAGLMAALTQGVIAHTLPTGMIIVGVMIGIFGIIIDEILKKRSGMRLAVLAIGLGIYLPPEITTPTILGGFTYFFAQRSLKKKLDIVPEPQRKIEFKRVYDRSILLACGLVAGAALMGVFLAVPFVLKGSSDALKIVGDKFTPIANLIGVFIAVILLGWLYRKGSHYKN